MTTAVRTLQARPRKRAPVVEDATRSVGAKLRALRAAQGLTLQQLSKASGVDLATISRIETGAMTGTLESHMKLATALGVKLPDLYAGIEEARTKDAVMVQPAAGRGDVYVHEAGKSSLTMLTTDILKKQLMPVLMAIEPGGSTQKEEARVGTEQFVYVLEGAVDAQVGESVHQLKRGSSLYFDASIPHHFRNPGRSTARCLSVMTPPAL